MSTVHRRSWFRGASTAVATVLLSASSVLLVCVTALPAAAHTELTSSTPEGGTTVARLPETVTLRFSEVVRTPVFVEVTGPGGADVTAGPVQTRDARVSQRLRAVQAGGEPGHYAVSYRVTSLDGHPISGTVHFTVRGSTDAADAADAAPAATTPSTTDASLASLGPTQLGLLLAALAVGLVALGVGTRRALRRVVLDADGADGR